MRKLILALAVTCYALIMAGCHTMAGAGQDIQEGGQKLEDSAKQHE